MILRFDDDELDAQGQEIISWLRYLREDFDDTFSCGDWADEKTSFGKLRARIADEVKEMVLDWLDEEIESIKGSILTRDDWKHDL